MSGPWERFAPAQPEDTGPWSKFASVPGTTVDDGGAPKPQPAKPAFDIDFTAEPKEVRKAINALPKEQRRPANEEWARVRVGKERADGIKPDLMYNLTAGTPVGSWLDEGEGAIQSGLYSLTGGRMGAPYDETVAIERERQKQAEDNSTKLGELPYIGDVRMSGVQKVLGGIASAPVTPVVRAMQGATMLPSVVNSALTGGLYGLIYGAGEQAPDGSRGGNAAMGTGVGAAIGAVVPPAARGLGNAANSLMDLFQPKPQAISPYSRGAINRVAEGVSADDLAISPQSFGTPGTYATKAAELGDRGMLADMGPNLRSQAGALANQPGEAKQVVSSAMEGRRAQAPAVIDQGMTDALGKPKNIPEFIDTFVKGRQQDAAPFYDAFYQAQVKPTPRLATLLERAQAAGAMQKAARLMQIEGIDPNQASNNGLFMDLIKRAVDDMAFEAKPGTNEARLFKKLGSALKQEVDDILVSQGAVAPHPDTGKPASVWEIARYYASDYKRTQEAVEAGQKAFSTGVHPDQMAADLAAMKPVDRTSFGYGARDAARTKMGNAAAAYGPSGDVAARRAFQSDFAKDKMRQIVGDPKAAELERVLKAESEFARTQDDVLRNSKTADRQAAQKMYPAAGDQNMVAAELRKSSLSGMAAEGVYRLANVLTGGMMNERRAKIATDAAKMLIAQGVERDRIVAALQQVISRRNVSARVNQQVQQFIETLGASTRAPAIDSATSSPAR